MGDKGRKADSKTMMRYFLLSNFVCFYFLLFATHTIAKRFSGIMETQMDVMLSNEEKNGIVTTVHVSPYIPTQEYVTEDPLFHCTYCGNKFKHKGPYIVHARFCKRRSELHADRKSLQDKPHFKICDKRIGTAVESGLEGPKKSCIAQEQTGKFDLETPATIKKVYTCIFCKQPFSVEFEFGKIRRRYACNDCTTKIRAEEKIRTAAKSETRFLCEKCGMLYKLEANFLRHMNKCTGFDKIRKKIR
ncbi:zinc finger protein 616 isoform X1 [Drosophila miranda]|uniref:zinc finger protein 616 isoform X1 n=2 Tax=Drosophila miranda TaxID=7229 RepID=UPI00143F5508|nr:zinc finger protein 616 isoform X1 [Drosophila miranda]